MPKTPIDYSKGFIYRLVCKDLSVKELYVGSSTNFRQRKSSHKSRCTKEGNKHYHYKVYQYIRDNGGWDNWDMIEIEKYPCNDEHELTKRERYWMEELKASLNSRTPSRTDKQWREDNKEIISQKHKEYNSRPEVKEHRKNHGKEYRSKPEVKQHIKEHKKEYYKKNSEQIKLKSIEWNKNNKDKKSETGKKYRERLGDILKQKKNKKYNCECGGKYTHCHKALHERSMKHQKFLQSQ